MITTTTTSVPERPAAAPWRQVSTGDRAVAVAQREALGTTARLAVWPPEVAGAAMAAVDAVLAALDLQASRFRPDSEISWLHRSAGGLFALSDGLAEAVRVALEAARWTGGLTDPTVGEALISLGYDRDFAAIDPNRREPPPAPSRTAGWQQVRLDGPLLWLPAGVRLDLGATAKGLGSDRAARAVMAATGHTGGVLISLGGDIATAGIPPRRDGWPIVAAGPANHPGSGPASAGPAQLVRLPRGAVATSSISCRSWRRAGRVLHHIVDPRTGLPAGGPGRRPAWPRSPVPMPTPPPPRRSWPVRRPQAGWLRRACPRGWSATTARCATSAAGQSMTAARSRFRWAATCTPGPDRALVHDERR